MNLNFLNYLITWNSAFEATPAGSDDPSGGDDRIREVKTAVGNRAEKEHVWAGTEAADGPHKEGSCRVYFQAAEPTKRPDGTTSLGSSDDGRLFVDSDNQVLKVYTGTAFSTTAAGGVVIYVNSSGTSTTTTKILRTKVLEIGDWDMDANLSTTIAHGLDLSNILGVEGTIRMDGDTYRWPLDGDYYVTTSARQCWVSLIDSANITLDRLDSGFFDRDIFDNTSFNRGWLLVQYKE